MGGFMNRTITQNGASSRWPLRRHNDSVFSFDRIRTHRESRRLGFDIGRSCRVRNNWVFSFLSRGFREASSRLHCLRTLARDIRFNNRSCLESFNWKHSSSIPRSGAAGLGLHQYGLEPFDAFWSVPSTAVSARRGLS